MTSQNLNVLLNERAELDLKIEKMRESEMQNALAKVRELVETFGLSAADIFPKEKRKGGKRGRPAKAAVVSKGKKSKAARKTGKIAPKYRDPATGKTWTGRGVTPRWLDGKKKEDFLI